MIPKQRRFLAIKYWVGTPASGMLVGPVLVSTSDYCQFHFWDEQDEATLGPGDYQMIKLYPLGMSFSEAQAHFAREFQSEQTREYGLVDSAGDLIWASLSRHPGQVCITA